LRNAFSEVVTVASLKLPAFMDVALPALAPRRV
jgi:hypothetical protein